MSTDQSSARARRRAQRGMTLVEVSIAMAVMAIAVLGLTAGIILSFGANGRASRRTQAAEFAQSSLERLMAASRKNICTGSFNGGVVNCSPMGTGTFDPNAAPNQGGWMLDVLDRASAMGSSAGVDLMAGPVVVLGDSGAIDEAATTAARAALLTEWGSGDNAATSGCGSTKVTATMLCREIHIELQDVKKVSSDPALNAYHVWVRVVQGGGKWRDGPVVQEGVIAQ